ncbi:uncharacterized protein LOC135391007 isoform X2 [Ornithodoros turicata]|uniref:uncharacterized protein LOC135391007 isoform X2 n=1 Tax=Ornithodoros turicata TaxID=34597 RepID=UPI0031398D3A
MLSRRGAFFGAQCGTRMAVISDTRTFRTLTSIQRCVPTTVPSLLWCFLVVSASISLCDSSCEFPVGWQGLWFQKGNPEPITITKDRISSKGRCKERHDTKYLIAGPTEDCLRCVGFNDKNANVLQYKETQICSTHKTLEEVCNEFTGDALLYSMFRVNAQPVPCPFHGPLDFSYSRGHAECADPVSTINSCTDNSRLLLRFQACADVQGSESRVETLTCLGFWKEGSMHYLVGKLDHRMAKTDEDKFRCFVYEKSQDPNTAFLVAQSADATCDGLVSPNEGSRTMKLRHSAHPPGQCQFPEWATSVEQWVALDGDRSYRFDPLHSNLTVSNSSQTLLFKVLCHEELLTHADTVLLVVHVTKGCDSGYTCMKMHKRASHVIEIQFGLLTSQSSEACSGHYDRTMAESITLLHIHPQNGECPLAGNFLMEGSQPQVARLVSGDPGASCPERSILSAGCASGDRLDIHLDCSPNKEVRSFQCHGSWEENGTYFLIASASQRQYCMAFSDNGKQLHFAESPKACVHNVQMAKDTFSVFNLTSTGQCQDVNSGSSYGKPRTLACIPLLAIYSFVRKIVH